MNFENLLGQKLKDTQIAKSSYQTERSEANDGWCVMAQDQSYELLLNEEERIRTIFLYPQKGTESFPMYGFTTQTSREEVRQKLGTPTSQGEEQRISILGKNGAYDRFDNPQRCLHIEYTLGQPKIKMITLMLPEVAP